MRARSCCGEPGILSDPFRGGGNGGDVDIMYLADGGGGEATYEFIGF